ncbi:DUF111 family protein, partial [Clostridioides difficile]|nr:nickel insertion protein [Clostridioides difficile]EQJ20203.1 hypothetical protein QS3_0220 [Clostridioides difficile P13]MDL0236639.1 DUF111 family protein [Clostridioides difficile]
MKKNRPATKVSILCNESDLEKFIKILLLETSTFGVRYNAYNREILERKFVKLDTKYGVVTVKLGYYKGKLVKATPEYNECKTIAKNEDIPIKKVFADINFRIKEEFSENLLT